MCGPKGAMDDLIVNSFHNGNKLSLCAAGCQTLRLLLPVPCLLAMGTQIFLPHARIHGYPHEHDFGSTGSPLLPNPYAESSSFLVQCWSPWLVLLVSVVITAVVQLTYLMDVVVPDVAKPLRRDVMALAMVLIAVEIGVVGAVLAQQLQVLPLPFYQVPFLP